MGDTRGSRLLGTLLATVLLAVLPACSGSDGTAATSSRDPATPRTASAPGTTPPAASTASSASTSASTSAAPTRLPQRVGVTFGQTLAGLSSARLAATLDDVVALGARWIRVDVSWAAIQPVSSRYFEWDALDRIVAAARSRSLSVLGLVSYTPAWARASGCRSFVCPPQDPDRFAAFAGSVAARYAGGPLRTYQVWNEPNLSTFWPDPDPAAYRTLLRASARAIRDEDASATVLFAGLSYSGAGDVDIAPATFLRQVCAARACTGGLVDAVGYDPYTYPRLPSDTATPFNAWQLMANPATGSEQLRAALTAAGLARTPIWVTGFGAPTTYRGASDPRLVSTARQGAILLDGLRLAGAARPLVGAYFVDTLRDDPAETGARGHFGLTAADGTRKPAFGVLRDALR